MPGAMLMGLFLHVVICFSSSSAGQHTTTEENRRSFRCLGNYLEDGHYSPNMRWYCFSMPKWEAATELLCVSGIF
jgi:hypothetical protein